MHGHGCSFARNKRGRPNTTPTARGICTFAVYFFAMMLNKIDRPNTTPKVRGICTFAVYFFAMMVNKRQAKHDSYGSWHLYICRLFCFLEIHDKSKFLNRGCQSLFARNLWRETETAYFRRVKKHFLIFFYCQNKI